MLKDKQFDIFIASHIGSFKHVKYYTESAKNSKKCLENLVSIKSLEKKDGITAMSWSNEHQTEIILAKKNGVIQYYDTEQGKFTKSYRMDVDTQSIVGVGQHENTLLAGVSSGFVKICAKTNESVITVGGKIDKMRIFQDDTTLFATGGQENDLKVWRLGETEPVFSAKNRPHDWLQLRVPIWVSDLAFMPGQGGNILAICSRYGYVRLYDTRAQRRPVCNVDFQNGMAATCLQPSFDDRQVLVGFGRGQLHQVDLRRGKPDKGYKGSVGGVTDIGINREQRLVVTTSLDRHLRVHSYDTKELVYKLYVTSKPSNVLIQTATSTPLLNPPQFEEKQEEIKEEDSDDLDELFDEMVPVREKRRKKDQNDLETENTKLETKIEDIGEVKPSTEGSTDVGIEDSIEDKEAKIMQLLKSTERQKRRMEKRKREKKAKSVFYNA
ncbi:WD repeat-containing protein 74 [Papilio xuthus]|uniref:WD repeat-containing protein 74 n=1 Tax=Papilio xuthus TaxID=66420 RepID=A0A0N1INA5_PAPXU|nr:WD repeat-containing protein 74 [Papilio xuthus]